MLNAIVSARVWSGLHAIKAMANNEHGMDLANDNLGEVNIREQRIAARIGVFIVISRFGTDAGDYCRSKLATGKASSPHTSRSDGL